MKRLAAIILSAISLVCLGGCGASTNISGVPNPEKIVPKQDALIERWKITDMRLQHILPLKARI